MSTIITRQPPIITWQPITSKGVPLEGYWRVNARTVSAAQMMIRERMQKRSYFILLREWIQEGERVEEVRE